MSKEDWEKLINKNPNELILESYFENISLETREEISEQIERLNQLLRECAEGNPEKINDFYGLKVRLDIKISYIQNKLKEKGINLELKEILQEMKYIDVEWKDVKSKIEELKMLGQKIYEKQLDGIFNEIHLMKINGRKAEIVYKILLQLAKNTEEIDINILDELNVDKDTFIQQIEREYRKKYNSEVKIKEKDLVNEKLWAILANTVVRVNNNGIYTGRRKVFYRSVRISKRINSKRKYSR